MIELIKSVETKIDACEYSKEQLESKCNGIYNRLLKRLLGFCIALILFVLLTPVLMLLSIAIVVDSGRPVFYRAYRGGYKGKDFRIYKFRTMVKNADKIGGGTTVLNDSRVTRIGRYLRQTKLDEIPQLINIIKGEMSFIGPRPELLKYTSMYEGLEQYILQVRPGITDFSSIEYINLDEIVGSENADEMYEKFVLQRKNFLRLKYVAAISFAVDLRLFFVTIFRTIQKSFRFLLIKGDIDGKAISR